VIRILLLGLVLAGVWYLYRMVTQQKGAAAPVAPAAEQAAVSPPGPEAEKAADAPGEAAREQAPPEPAMAEAEEMIECPLCQAYVPETAHDGCGRPDCPIPTLASGRAAAGG